MWRCATWYTSAVAAVLGHIFASPSHGPHVLAHFARKVGIHYGHWTRSAWGLPSWTPPHGIAGFFHGGDTPSTTHCPTPIAATVFDDSPSTGVRSPSGHLGARRMVERSISNFLRVSGPPCPHAQCCLGCLVCRAVGCATTTAYQTLTHCWSLCKLGGRGASPDNNKNI